MRTVLREHGGEALLGFAVLLLAAWFVMFAWERTGGGAGSDDYHVTALFPNASGVSVGTDVRVAGLKVGAVSDMKLDPQSYQVSMRMALSPSVKLPSDSSAAITSEGLLGGTYVALTPGGSTDLLKDGSQIVDTQGSMDLMGLIGSFINKSGGSGGTGGAATGNSAAPAPAP